MKGVNDVREYEEEEQSKAAAGLLRDSQAANNDDDAGHHKSAQGWAAPSHSLMWLMGHSDRGSSWKMNWSVFVSGSQVLFVEYPHE